MKQAKLRRLVLGAMVGLSLAASGVVATPAPASAATPESARLYISPSQEHPGYYNVVVSGHFNTTAPSTTVGMRLKGADFWFDDDLGVSVTGQAWYGDFSLYALVWHGTLNEDPEGGDEIYASVRSSTGWSRNTPEVSGHF
jgi:hypothetical protein